MNLLSSLVESPETHQMTATSSRLPLAIFEFLYSERAWASRCWVLFLVAKDNYMP